MKLISLMVLTLWASLSQAQVSYDDSALCKTGTEYGGAKIGGCEVIMPTTKGFHKAVLESQNLANDYVEQLRKANMSDDQIKLDPHYINLKAHWETLRNAEVRHQSKKSQHSEVKAPST